jgi:LacI family transcriptional regulator
VGTRTVTIIDIAKALGVSKSTVSRALMNHPDISEEMKDRVRQISRDLNYVKNVTASSLRYKKSKLIGLIVPEISYFFFPSVINGIEAVAHSKGYNLLILQSNEQYEREVENVDILLSNNVEGILASVSRTTKSIDHFVHLTEHNIPLVLFDRIVQEINADLVLVDDVDASIEAVDHLIKTGRKRIAICTGDLNLLISRNRLSGYKRAFINNGIDVDESLIIEAGSSEEAERNVQALFHLDSPPDGIFAISDLTMNGVMKALHKLGKRIPEDVSVIGFCEEQYRSMYHPTLTAIDPMGFEIGKKAVEMLFEQIHQQSQLLPVREPKTVYLKSHLVFGGST